MRCSRATFCSGSRASLSCSLVSFRESTVILRRALRRSFGLVTSAGVILVSWLKGLVSIRRYTIMACVWPKVKFHFTKVSEPYFRCHRLSLFSSFLSWKIFSSMSLACCRKKASACCLSSSSMAIHTVRICSSRSVKVGIHNQLESLPLV